MLHSKKTKEKRRKRKMLEWPRDSRLGLGFFFGFADRRLDLVDWNSWKLPIGKRDMLCFFIHISCEQWERDFFSAWLVWLMNFRVSLFRGSPTGFVQRSLIAQAYKTGIASSASSTLCFVVLLFVIHIPAVFSTSSKQEKNELGGDADNDVRHLTSWEYEKKRRRKKENSVLFFSRLAKKRPREMRKIINKEIDIPQCIKSPEAASKRVLRSGEQVDRTERSSFRFIQFIKLLLCAPRCSKFSAEERSELIGALNLNELRASWLVLSWSTRASIIWKTRSMMRF